MRGMPSPISVFTASSSGVSSGGGAVALPISSVISPFTESRDASCARIFGGRAAQILLVDFGEFARHHHGPRAERRFDGLQRFQNAVRRFVENQRGLLFGQRLQRLGALPRLGGQKSAEVEGVGGQAGSRPARSATPKGRARPAPECRIDGGAHQAVAGVGDQRHARVGDQRDRGSGEQARDASSSVRSASLCS